MQSEAGQRRHWPFLRPQCLSPRLRMPRGPLEEPEILVDLATSAGEGLPGRSSPHRLESRPQQFAELRYDS